MTDDKAGDLHHLLLVAVVTKHAGKILGILHLDPKETRDNNVANT